jgi:hypothetical protein
VRLAETTLVHPVTKVVKAQFSSSRLMKMSMTGFCAGFVEENSTKMQQIGTLSFVKKSRRKTQ